MRYKEQQTKWSVSGARWNRDELVIGIIARAEAPCGIQGSEVVVREEREEGQCCEQSWREEETVIGAPRFCSARVIAFDTVPPNPG